MEFSSHAGILSAVDSANAELTHMQSLPAESLESLRRALRVEMVFESNAIDGNGLTLLETKVVLEDGLTVGGKRLRDYMDAVGYAAAFDEVWAMGMRDAPLSVRGIKAVHSAMMRLSDPGQAGHYRTENPIHSWAGFTPPDPDVIPAMMEKLLEWYEQESGLYHPLERAARFHARFVGIRPFSEGNGRMARLLMNLILLRAHYPIAIIRNCKRLEYFSGVDAACSKGHMDLLVKVVGDAVLETVQKYRNLNNPPRPRWKRG